MKKILTMAATAMLMVNSIAFAGTSVDWFAYWGMYPNGAPDVSSATPGTGVAASQSVIWQLVYAGNDNTIDLLDVGNSAAGYVYNDDVVVDSRLVPAGGGTVGGVAYDEWLWSASRPAFESATTYTGFFYARVIGDTTPALGEWYYNTSLIAAQNIDLSDPLRSPQLLDMNPNGSSGVGNALDTQIVAVPEPSSMALLALGLGVVALRRKFRK